MGKGKKPRIRFKGFTDDWEQRKLGEIAEIIGGGTPNTNNPTYWDGDIDWYAPAEIGEQIFANGSVRKITKEGLDHCSAKVLPAYKTVLFTSRAGIGNMAILQHSAATNQGFQSLVCHNDIEPYFVFTMGNNIKVKAERVAAGSTFAEISGKKLSNLEFMFPNTAEQKVIGAYFKNFDLLITLHQRKLDKLKIIKKFMLENMFPKNEEKRPRIRFSGFTDDWEQRKLGEIAEIIGGGTPNTNNPTYWDGDIDWYAPAEIGEQIFANGSVRKITKEGLDHCSAKVLPAYKTVLFTSRAGIGNMAILQHSAATNQGFQSLVCHNDIEPYFVFTMGNNIKVKAERVAAGSTFAEISGKKLSNLEFMFPNTAEQKVIGAYFKNFDLLITLHQRKLDKLKKIKKSMLDKMFV